jgi:SNF2 family DNA or RNA helicase
MAPILLRRTMEDTGEPVVGMTHTIVPCPLGSQQNAEYERTLFDPSLDIGVRLGALRRIAGGSGWPNPKLARALELIGNVIGRGQQVLVASDFRAPNDSLAERLRDARIPHVVMDGRTPPAERAEMAERFKTGEIPIALIGLKSGAEGMSYPRCNNVILLNYSWEYKKLPQVIHRARRINSQRDLEVWSLVAEGTIEQRMAQLVVDEKGAAADLVLDGRWPTGGGSEDWLAIAAKEFQAGQQTVDESELVSQWPGLRVRLRASTGTCRNSHPPSRGGQWPQAKGR